MNPMHPLCYPNCSCEPFSTGLILQPWAFWTSLLYPIAIYFVLKRNPNVPKAWTSAIILMTIASLVAHARFDLYSLALDDASVVVILFAYHRGPSSWTRAILTNLISLLGIAVSLIFIPIHLWVTLIFGAFIISWRIAAVRRGTKIFKEKEFLMAMTVYGISFFMFHFDANPMLCLSKWVPYGHPMWHVGSAITMFLLGDWWYRGT